MRVNSNRRRRGAALAIVLMILVIAIIIIGYVVSLNFRSYQSVRYGLSKEMLTEVSKDVTLTVATMLRNGQYWDFENMAPYSILKLNQLPDSFVSNVCNVYQNIRLGETKISHDSSSDSLTWSCTSSRGPSTLLPGSLLGTLNQNFANSMGLSATEFQITLTPSNDSNLSLVVDVSALYTGIGKRAPSWSQAFNQLPASFKNVLLRVSRAMEEEKLIIVTTVRAVAGSDNELYSKRTYWVFEHGGLAEALIKKASYVSLASHVFDPFGLDMVALAQLDDSYRTDDAIGFASGDFYTSSFVAMKNADDPLKVFGDNSYQGAPYGSFVNPSNMNNILKPGVLGLWSNPDSNIPNVVAGEFYGDVAKLYQTSGGDFADRQSTQMMNELLCNGGGDSCSLISPKFFLNNFNANQVQWTVESPEILKNIGSKSGAVFDTLESNGRYSFTSKVVSASSGTVQDPTTLYISIETGDEIGVVKLNDRSVVEGFTYNPQEEALEVSNTDSTSGRWIEVPWNDANNDGKLNVPYLAKMMEVAATAPSSDNQPTPDDAFNDEWLQMNSDLPGVANFIMSTHYDGDNTIVEIRAIGKYSRKPISDFTCNYVRIPQGAQASCQNLGDGEVRLVISTPLNSNDTTPERVALAVRGGNVILSAPSTNPDTPPNVPITVIAAPSDKLTTRDVPGNDPAGMLSLENVRYEGGQLNTDYGDPSDVDLFFVRSVKIQNSSGNYNDIRKLDFNGDGNPDVSFGETGMWLPVSKNLLDAIRTGSNGSVSVTSSAFRYVLPDPTDSYDTAYQRYRVLMSLEGNVVVTNMKDETVYQLLTGEISPDDFSSELPENAVAGIGLPLEEDDINTINDKLSQSAASVDDLVTDPQVKEILNKSVKVNVDGNDVYYEPAPINVVATNYVFLVPVDYSGNVSLPNTSNKVFAFKGFMVSLNHSLQILDRDAAKYLLASGDNPDNWYESLKNTFFKRQLSDSLDGRKLLLVYGGVFSVFGDVEGVLLNENTVLGFDSQLFVKLPDKVIDSFKGPSGDGILDLVNLWRSTKVKDRNGEELVTLKLIYFFEE